MKKKAINDFTDWFCESFNVDKSILFDRSRKQHKCFIRHCYCAMAHSQGFFHSEIAEYLDKHNSTIHQSIERHKVLIHYKDYQEVIGKKVMV